MEGLLINAGAGGGEGEGVSVNSSDIMEYQNVLPK